VAGLNCDHDWDTQNVSDAAAGVVRRASSEAPLAGGGGGVAQATRRVSRAGERGDVAADSGGDGDPVLRAVFGEVSDGFGVGGGGSAGGFEAVAGAGVLLAGEELAAGGEGNCRVARGACAGDVGRANVAARGGAVYGGGGGVDSAQSARSDFGWERGAGVVPVGCGAGGSAGEGCQWAVVGAGGGDFAGGTAGGF